MTKQKKWTIWVVAQYDDTNPLIKDAYEELEESILVQKRNDNIEYLIYFYNQTSGESCIKKLRYGYYGVPQFFIFRDLGKIDFYNEITLIDFFNENTGRYIDEDHQHANLIITWGHGAGYGFFAQAAKQKNNFNSYTDAGTANSLSEIQFLKAQFSIADDDITSILLQQHSIKDTTDQRPVTRETANAIKVISISQLKNIIEKSLKKADILLCMNCYMQTFEAGYILKNVVDLMIAPQVMISFYGYNYVKLFNLLHENPETNFKNIAQNIITYYPIKFSEEPIRSRIRLLGDQLMDVKKVSFSALFLNAHGDLFALINDISKYLIMNRSEVLINHCKKARNKCLSVKENLVIDFRHFFVEFCRYYDGALLNTYKNDLFQFQSKLYNYREENMAAILQPGILSEAELSRDLLPSINPQGFSIFFPVSQARSNFEIKKLLFGYGNSIQNSTWIKFVEILNDPEC